MPYGVTSDGFVRKPYEVILQEINDDQLANVSPTLDLSPESPQGQLNAAFARQVAFLWEIAEVAFHGIDPDAAEDFLLQNIAKLTGTARRGTSHSTVTATVNLNSGTTLISGTHFANVTGQPDNRWTPVADFTASSTGSHAVLFRAEETGPITAEPSSIEVINTSLDGWNSITNSLAATVGRNIDNDETLRLRREADVAQTGSGTVQAIRADVNDVENVVSVTVLENKGDTRDANGLPPHSVEVLVDDGDPPAADDDAIAHAIFDATGAGTAWYSSTGDSGTATDSQGVEHVVPFSRIAFVSIHLAYELEVNGDEYVAAGGDAAFKDFIVAQATALYPGVGAEVVALRLESVALRFPGVVDVVAFALDTSDSPAGTSNIELRSRQKPSFNEANIDVTS